MNFKRFITIHGYGYAMAAILDAIFKMIAYPMWDFGGLCVCYLWYQIKYQNPLKNLLYNELKDL